MAQLEMEDTVAGGIGSDTSQMLGGGYALTATHTHIGQVVVDGVVVAVADDDGVGTAKIGYGDHLAREDAAGLCSAMAGEVDTLVVELHATEAGYIVGAVTAGDGIAARDRYRQTATVFLEIVAELYVGIVGLIEFDGRLRRTALAGRSGLAS